MVCEAFAVAFPEVFEAHVVSTLEVDDTWCGGTQDRRQREFEVVDLKK